LLCVRPRQRNGVNLKESVTRKNALCEIAQVSYSRKRRQLSERGACIVGKLSREAYPGELKSELAESNEAMRFLLFLVRISANLGCRLMTVKLLHRGLMEVASPTIGWRAMHLYHLV
jgi:hypothetical protein